MSSWLGHGLAAYAVARLVNGERLDPRLTVGVVGLSIAPDVIDQFIDMPYPNLGHSVVGVLVLGVVGYGLMLAAGIPRHRGILFGICLAAAGSHLLLDVFANAPKYMLLWPFSTERFGIDQGFLPAAPALRLNNFYMYRNLLLETAIFLPAALLAGRKGATPIELILGTLSAATGIFVSATMIR